MSRLIYYGVSLLVYLLLFGLLKFIYQWVPLNTATNILAILLMLMLIPVSLIVSKHLLEFIKTNYRP